LAGLALYDFNSTEIEKNQKRRFLVSRLPSFCIGIYSSSILFAFERIPGVSSSLRKDLHNHENQEKGFYTLGNQGNTLGNLERSLHSPGIQGEKLP